MRNKLLLCSCCASRAGPEQAMRPRLDVWGVRRPVQIVAVNVMVIIVIHTMLLLLSLRQSLAMLHTKPLLYLPQERLDLTLCSFFRRSLSELKRMLTG